MNTHKHTCNCRETHTSTSHATEAFCRFDFVAFPWFCAFITAGLNVPLLETQPGVCTRWLILKIYVASVRFWLPAPSPPRILINIYIVMSLRFPQSKRNQRRYRWRWIESHLIICGFERLCRFIPASPSSDVCQCRALTQSEERLRGVFRRTSQSLKSTQRRIRGVVAMCSGAPHSLM